MGTTKTLVMSVKIMLMSTGILTIAILLFTLSSSIPTTILSSTTTSSNLSSLFSTLRSWLRPPYLYFLINAIIAAIAFLHHNHHHQNPHAPPPPPSKPMMMSSHHHHDIHHHHPNNSNNHDVISFRADHVQYTQPYDVVSVTDHDHNVVGEFKSSYDYNDVVSVKDVEVEVVGKFADEVEKRKSTVDVDDDHDVHVDESTVVEPSTWTAPPPLMRQVAVKKVLSERPPASSRFSQHRRLAKAAPTEGGKALRVHKPKKHDTLESTWKAITEGRHVPLNRHLKKSDTWENHPRQIDLLDDDDSSPIPKPAVKKSETFKERTNYMTPPHVAPSRLKKEPSLGHDELNRRVEAFINKFNEDMRLQRQESMQQFMEMINRAA